MKLPALPVCHLTCSFGNPFQMTVMGEVLTDELSDAGSTPARSIRPRHVELMMWRYGKRDYI